MSFNLWQQMLRLEFKAWGTVRCPVRSQETVSCKFVTAFKFNIRHPEGAPSKASKHHFGPLQVAAILQEKFVPDSQTMK